MRNRAAPVALARTICRPRSPTASGTPCRNSLAGNTALLVQFALFAPSCFRVLPSMKGRLLLITAPRCKAAGLAFIGAKRRALAEEADGSGAGSSQEGHLGLQESDTEFRDKDSPYIGIALRHDPIA